MSYWRPKEMVDIAAGKVPGYAAVNKFGRNSDVDTADAETIWDGGGIWVAPTAARTHDIVSTSSVDAAAGTGAQTIRIFGLTSWSTAEVSEDITMNGTTNVPTVNSYVIIHRMFVLTAGSGQENAGTITATAQANGTVTAQITIGENQSLMAIYGVPSTQALFITQWYLAMNRAQATGSIDGAVTICGNPESTNPVYRLGQRQGVTVTGSSFIQPFFDPPAKIEGPAIVTVEARDASANNTDVSAGFNGVLVDV